MKRFGLIFYVDKGGGSLRRELGFLRTGGEFGTNRYRE